MLGVGHRFRFTVALAVVTLVAAMAANALPTPDPALEAMKAKLSSASIGDRPHLCVQIAEHQLTETDKLYAAFEVEDAQTKLTDVVTYSEMARDYAIQSHKYQKQTEIAVRVMSRKLSEVLHVLGRDEQAPVREAINRLQRVRDDLLMAMFPKGAR
jgi:hypothetical protein